MNLKLLRIGAAVVHALTLLGGLFLFGLAIFVMAYPTAVMMQLEMDTVIAISSFVCAMAIMIIVISGIGLTGTVLSSHKILKVFLTMLLIVFLMEVCGIVVPFAMRRRWEDKFNLQIFAIMDKYGMDEYPYVTRMWDDFQVNLGCCGSAKPEDWSFSAFVQQEYYPVLIPPSCCKSFNDPEGIRPKCFQRNDPTLYYTKGCLTVTKELIWTYSGLIGGFVSAVFCFQIIVILVTVVIIKELMDYYGEDDERDNDYKFAPPPSAAPLVRKTKNSMPPPAPPLEMTINDVDGYSSSKPLRVPDAPEESHVDDSGFDI